MSPPACARMRRRAPRWPLALAALATTAALSGCAGVPARPPAPSTTRPAPGYVKRVDELSAVDASSLAGRRIALDPGHGGIFRGALGVDGLTEAEVNLGVALHLRGLLEAHGATVFMTRTDDRDFLIPADSTLRFDLAERTRLANEFHPDLFLSIHHNADARGAHDVNETQTYYKLGDDGPSLDAAADVHRYLVRNLGITRHRIMPGNYFVLRNSEAPALLTESSYLTNPDVEKKLALAAKQRLEAEALFLGLAKYFARRVPVIEEFVARAAEGAPPETLFDGAGAMPTDELWITARIRGEFDRVDLTLDGAAVPALRRDSLMTWRLGLLPSGRHDARLRIRLSGVGAAAERHLSFRIAREPNELVFSSGSPLVGPEGGVAAVRIEIHDDEDVLYPDSAGVRLVADSRGILPRDTLVWSRDGVAWAYFRIAPHTPRGAIRGRVGIRPIAARDEPETSHWEFARRSARPEPGPSSGFVIQMPEGMPLRDAPGTNEPRRANLWLNRDGFGVWSRDPSGHPIAPTLPGYRIWASDSNGVPRFAAIAGGALHGRRVTLDPDGGGEDAAGTGPSGTRASTLNLEVARALAGYLIAAGAEVRLTREGDFSMSDVERVQVSEAFHADRFVRIGHAAEPPMLGYYFSSAGGKRMAEHAAAAFASLGLASPRLAEDAQYPLQQTSCPALYVSTARIDVAASEEALLGPGALRGEAYALFVALAREWAPDAQWPADSIEVHTADGNPVAGAAVTLGGALVVETDALGRARFARTEAGPIEASVEDSRVRARTVLLESSRGTILTGSIGR